jgi:DNA repair protein RadC
MEHCHGGHRERVRDRFFAEGMEHFAPHEVLEFLLYTTIAREDTNPIAHRLIDHFGSLAGVFEARYEDLLKVEGVGPKSALLLCMVPDLARAYLIDSEKERAYLNTVPQMVRYLKPRFLGAAHEKFYVVCLDDKHSAIACQCLNEGLIDRVNVDLRKILEMVLRTSATNIILAHNHPSQIALPSPEDVEVTKNIANMLKPIGVRVLDHLVFSKEDCVSMHDSGAFLNIYY